MYNETNLNYNQCLLYCISFKNILVYSHYKITFYAWVLLTDEGKFVFVTNSVNPVFFHILVLR